MPIVREDKATEAGYGGKREAGGLRSGITFYHPRAFWGGVTALVAGVIMHFPDYVRAGDVHYHMAGMPMSGVMLFGMVLILVGISLAAYGLFPRHGAFGDRDTASAQVNGFDVRVMDDAPLTTAHWRLVSALCVALVVDVMKPATLGFVIPGTIAEYGLTPAQVAWWPVIALAGTTVGSVVWGVLADRLGRRATILLASLLFIGTAICGAMPAFGWNLLMCFFMGASAGGMLPIVFALLAETIPAKQRGWLTVLVGGLGTVGGYLVASGSAALLEPHFNWRILWFLGLPTGALVIALNRFIPESPRFLLAHGRVDEARHVMEIFGILVQPGEAAEGATVKEAGGHPTGMLTLFRRPFRAQTVSLGLLGVAWGLVNWGFLTWLPTILGEIGLERSVSNGILASAALIAVPGTLLVAWLYGYWSSKKSMIVFALMTAFVLGGLATLSTDVAGKSGQLMLLVGGLLFSSSGVIAMLSPYSVEVYPTDLRGIGAGMVAASSKVGGIVGPSLVAAVVGLWPGLTAAALLVAGPIAVAALALSLNGIETRGRRLEDIYPVSQGEIP